MRVVVCLLAQLFLLWQPGLYAADYPEKPIRMIVGFPPGGGADIMARVITDELSEEWHMQVVVDNRPGAGSSTATGLSAKASPDGYTLLFATTSFTINPNLYHHVPYDAIKDFAPVSEVASTPFVLVAQQAFPASSVQELIALAKKEPGALNYSSGGNGSTGHLAGELFKSMAGIKMQHIPYKGVAPALTDLLGGRVQLTMSSLPSCINYIHARRLKALALTTAKRMPFAAEIPTMAEAGLRGYDVDQWYGIFAPAGTPRPIVAAVHRSLAAFLAKPSKTLTGKFTKLGSRPLVSTPSQFAVFVRENLEMWRRIVKESGARVE